MMVDVGFDGPLIVLALPSTVFSSISRSFPSSGNRMRVIQKMVLPPN